jgi:hypothetical protein
MTSQLPFPTYLFYFLLLLLLGRNANIANADSPFFAHLILALSQLCASVASRFPLIVTLSVFRVADIIYRRRFSRRKRPETLC